MVVRIGTLARSATFGVRVRDNIFSNTNPSNLRDQIVAMRLRDNREEWNLATATRTFGPIGNKSSTNWIGEEIGDQFFKGEAVPVRFTEDAVVGLLLEPLSPGLEPAVQPSSKPSRGGQLVAAYFDPTPDEMNMIRHQAVGRTPQTMETARMNQRLSKKSVEFRVEPACFSLVDRMCPMNDREAAVVAMVEPAQMIAGLFWHRGTVYRRIGPVHKRKWAKRHRVAEAAKLPVGCR